MASITEKLFQKNMEKYTVSPAGIISNPLAIPASETMLIYSKEITDLTK